MQLIKATARCLNSTTSTLSRGCSVQFIQTYSSVKGDKSKPKRRARKSKTQTETKTEVQHTQAVPSFPFEGVDSANHYDRSSTVERVDSLSGVRHYLINFPEESYCFPSVTTVLDGTESQATYFKLQNWRKGLVKEHGKQGFINIARDIIQSGKNFHKEIENKLLNSSQEQELISIKPNVNIKPSSRPHSLSNSSLKTYKPQMYKPVYSLPTKVSKIQPFLPSQEIVTNEVNESISMEDNFEELISEEEKIASSESLEETVIDKKSINEDPNNEGSLSIRNNGYMTSVKDVLSDIGTVYALESLVSHIELGYTGTFDCLAEYKGTLCVIDWKTSSKPKPTLSDCLAFPLQAAAYAGAINQDSQYPCKVRNALIVVVYPTGDPCHAHFLSHDQLLSYWDEWLKRLDKYHTQFASDLSQLTFH